MLTQRTTVYWNDDVRHRRQDASMLLILDREKVILMSEHVSCRQNVMFSGLMWKRVTSLTTISLTLPTSEDIKYTEFDSRWVMFRTKLRRNSQRESVHIDDPLPGYLGYSPDSSIPLKCPWQSPDRGCPRQVCGICRRCRSCCKLAWWLSEEQYSPQDCWTRWNPFVILCDAMLAVAKTRSNNIAPIESKHTMSRFVCRAPKALLWCHGA